MERRMCSEKNGDEYKLFNDEKSASEKSDKRKSSIVSDHASSFGIDISFCYKPLYGVLIAFQDYLPGSNIIGEGVKWVGLKHFEKFVTSYYFVRIIKNTLILSGLVLLFGFWVPIVFALLLNEVTNGKLRKVIQTISYLPHFISAVVIAGMVLSFTAEGGLITELLNLFGMDITSLNTNKGLFHGCIPLPRSGRPLGGTVSCICQPLRRLIPVCMRRLRLMGLPGGNGSAILHCRN